MTNEQAIHSLDNIAKIVADDNANKPCEELTDLLEALKITIEAIRKDKPSEPVHCRECIFYERDKEICTNGNGYLFPSDGAYCGYGERKE